MKVTIILLAAVCCFAAINAVPSEQIESAELYVDDLFGEEFFSDKMMSEPHMYNIFSPFFWHLKYALRLLKGVNCTIKQVLSIKSITNDFLTNVQSCGADAVKNFGKVISCANKVITICDNIINLKEKVCNNNVSPNGKDTTSWSCSRKLFVQLYLLRNEINNTLKAIKKLPAVPGDAAFCTNSAVNILIDVFAAFPSNIKICSKLTNN